MAEKTELLEEDEKVVEIELERLRGFENHSSNIQYSKHDLQQMKNFINNKIAHPLEETYDW